MDTRPCQNLTTVARHLVADHGETYAYAYAQHPRTLLDEHARIHQAPEPRPGGVAHTHAGDA